MTATLSGTMEAGPIVLSHTFGNNLDSLEIFDVYFPDFDAVFWGHQYGLFVTSVNVI
jgi:hypothetical protein